MAEENDNNLSEEEYKVRRRINKQAKEAKKEKPCRTRFDVLATPHKRAILDVYQHHAHLFPKDKVERLKQKLQELYAMTPEEAERYFEQMRNEADDIAKHKMMKIMLKRLYLKQLREKQEAKAYRFIEKLVKQGMTHAFNNPVPPLISIRLRNLSEIILEQICDLRNVDIPNRDDPDQCGLFLLALADWTAIAIEHIYYAVQLKKYEELAQIEAEAIEEGKEKKKDKKEKKGKKEMKEEEEDEGEREKPTTAVSDGDFGDMTEPDFE